MSHCVFVFAILETFFILLSVLINSLFAVYTVADYDISGLRQR